jgi:hypothetical protein
MAIIFLIRQSKTGDRADPINIRYRIPVPPTPGERPPRLEDDVLDTRDRLYGKSMGAGSGVGRCI